MSVVIDLTVEIEVTKEQQEAINIIDSCLQQAAKVEELPDVQVSVTITNNQEIQEINAEHRGMDRPTDVLSFPLYEADEEWMLEEGEEAVAIGDIVISLDRAIEQATDYGHSLSREMGFLAVHGFLHLLGYDHETPEQEKEMFRSQELILDQIGLRR
ncbi:rRNA maturation RNase YbeY [Baia soyae]|uniref:Endoribonuclease YbeY n=1 Tax=Baia soyae TaxID=1544746 RepID=A0A4R2RPW3_9BACL|nr:rRNA maturation RNase YbeY [Baia soyae]TCP65108.1 putative rRNA maturation factor [Baia soyae]